MVNIIKEQDLYEHIKEFDVILVGTNIYNTLSQGFQRKIMLNYPYVHEQNMQTRYGDANKLGTMLECKKDDEPLFTLLYITKGNFRPDLNKDFLSYESLDKCMKLVNILYKGKNVASTIIGASRFDGNGDKDKVLEIINKNSNNINLTLFDYTQLSRLEELKKIRDAELEIKKTDINKYYEAVKKRKEEAEKRFENNKHARY